MNCQKCGKKLKKNETFCSICGYYNSDSDREDLYKHSDNWDLDEIEIKTDDKSLEDEVVNAEEYEEVDYDEDDDYDFDKDSLVDIVSETDAEDKGDKSFKLKANSSGTKEDDFYYEYEDYFEYYIGEDYKVIKKSPFNIYAFLLNLMYVLYRKLYFTGIIGLALTCFVVLKFPKFIILYAIAMMLLIGFGFNKYYIFVSKIKLERIIKRNKEKDKFELEKYLTKIGGVNVPFALVMYILFLVITFILYVKINSGEKVEKFWKENTENKANCISLTKSAYKEIEVPTNGNRIVEATCKITQDGDKKVYEIYIKNLTEKQEYYSYYKTRDEYIVYKGNTREIEEYEKKEAENSLTENEKEYLLGIKSAKEEYIKIYNKSKEEDELIKKNKNDEEKLNYVISKEEITRE